MTRRRMERTIKAWIDIYIYKVMTDEDKVKYIEKTETNLLMRVFKYISKNKNKNEANEVLVTLEKISYAVYLMC
jgi:hypothetical protein